MDELGTLKKHAGRYEFSFPELELCVRGPYAEWVLQAAAEIMAKAEKLRSEGHLDELEMLKEFGEASEVDVDAAQFEANARFEALPQCVVSLGSLDYRWVAGGQEDDAAPMTRIVDMSLTRNDTFLRDEPQA
ncbi:MAG: hypothetical protein AAFW46_04660 [Pseudomonadota bacterium]